MGFDPAYSHTQKGIIFPILAVSSVGFIIIGIFLNQYAPIIFGGLLIAISFAFMRMAVRDEGDRLSVRFGPIPIFGRTIPYAAISGVEKDRTQFIHGWGIHWTRKGWLWNIGGFDCVRVHLGGRSVLIGTDDPDGLEAFLRSAMAAGGSRTSR
jgi:hypothetical protein